MITEEVRGWFTGRLPASLFQELVDVAVDREEITVIGRIGEPELAAGVSEVERAAAVEGRVAQFRENTREDRIEIARQAEVKFGRKVSWGVECAGTRALYSTVSAPVMTRLRQPERQVLDLLVEGGVARSRSDALLWCVRLVQRHTGDWLDDLKESLIHVQQVRDRRPDAETDEQA